MCFLIHSTSPAKSINEMTARASLTQMINLIFLKLERFSTVYSLDSKIDRDIALLPSISTAILSIVPISAQSSAHSSIVSSANSSAGPDVASDVLDAEFDADLNGMKIILIVRLKFMLT